MRNFHALRLALLALACAGIQAQAFTFAVVGDRTGSATPGVFEAVIEEIKLLQPDFVINVGDLIEGYSEDTLRLDAQWDTLLSVIKGLSAKFYFVPGNHDLQNETDRRLFKRRTGFDRYYSFDYQNSHFIVLDNSMTQWAIPQPVDSAQMVWLKADLEKSKAAANTFVFFHVPTFLDGFRDNRADPLSELLEKFQVRIIFAGHYHSYMYLARGPTQYVDVGSSGGGLDNNDFARGNFFQFVLVTMRQQELEVAVIRQGSIFNRNVVTGDDYLAIARADTSAVKFSRLIVEELPRKVVLPCSITITNFGPDSISQLLQWTAAPKQYRFAPPNLPLAIAPQEKKNVSFNLTVFDGSALFPLPQFTVAYPFAYGKICTLRNPVPITRQKTVVRAKPAPIIDGKLDDPAWKHAKPITNLGRYDGQAPGPTDRTEIYLVHDQDDLYLAARCIDQDMAKIKSAASEHDGPTYYDDNIWFFFDSDLDRSTYHQAIINARGVVFDRSCVFKNGQAVKDQAWNGPWEVKSGREANAWTLEIKVPKKKLGPANDQAWGFNFRRLQTRINDAGYWSIPFDHDPRTFSLIDFE